jgi:excinuclease ABC subunit B
MGKDEHACLLGVTGSGKTFTMANVIAGLQRPTLVISHNKTLAAQLYEEFQASFPQQRGRATSSATTTTTSPKRTFPSATSTSRRTPRATTISIACGWRDQLAGQPADVIIVASVSCIFGLGSPEDYKAMMIPLAVGDQIDRDELLRQADRHPVRAQRHGLRARASSASAATGRNLARLRGVRLPDRVVGATRSRRLDFINPTSGRSARVEGPECSSTPPSITCMPEDRIASRWRADQAELEQRLMEFKRHGASCSKPSAWLPARATTSR